MEHELLSYIDYEICAILMVIAAAAFIMLYQNKKNIGFMPGKQQFSYMMWKKWIFILSIFAGIIIIPIMGVRDYKIIKNGDFKCAIGEIDQSDKDYSEEVYFKRFYFDDISGERHIFKSDDMIFPKKVLSPGKQTYVLYRGGKLYSRLYKMGYLEKNTKKSELEEASKMLIEQYVEGLELDILNPKIILNRIKKMYPLYIVFFIPAIIILLNFIFFRRRYSELLKKIKSSDETSNIRINSRDAIENTRAIFEKKKLARFLFRFRPLRKYKYWSKFKFVNAKIKLSHIKRVFFKGKVVYGHIITANPILFSKKERESAPGIILFSTDKYYDSKPYELRALGNYIYDLLESEEVPHKLEQIINLMNRDTASFLNTKIPMEYTRGREVFITCTLVDRKYLPYGYIKNDILPLLVNPEKTKATAVLPKQYWSNDMLLQWHYEI